MRVSSDFELLEPALIFQMQVLEARSLHSNSFNKKDEGFFGNCMPLIIAQGGTSFFLYILHVWHYHSTF